MLKLTLKHLLKLLHLWSNNNVTVRLISILLTVILVVVFGGVKLCVGRDLRYNGIIEGTAFIEFGLVFFGFFFLFVVVIEDHTAVLRTNVSALSVERGRVVGFPENLQQLIVRDLFRIIHHLYHLCM